MVESEILGPEEEFQIRRKSNGDLLERIDFLSRGSREISLESSLALREKSEEEESPKCADDEVGKDFFPVEGWSKGKRVGKKNERENDGSFRNGESENKRSKGKPMAFE
jgi:hypothetical protein